MTETTEAFILNCEVSAYFILLFQRRVKGSICKEILVVCGGSKWAEGPCWTWISGGPEGKLLLRSKVGTGLLPQSPHWLLWQLQQSETPLSLPRRRVIGASSSSSSSSSRDGVDRLSGTLLTEIVFMCSETSNSQSTGHSWNSLGAVVHHKYCANPQVLSCLAHFLCAQTSCGVRRRQATPSS